MYYVHLNSVKEIQQIGTIEFCEYKQVSKDNRTAAYFEPQCTRAVWKVRVLAAVRHCYAEGSSDYYATL
jgi:hypothetical protein